MSLINVTAKNAGLIEKQLALFPQKAEKVFGIAVVRSGEALRDHTKKLRHVSAKTTGYGVKGIPVDTGRLRQSIHSKRLRKLAVGVFPKVKYGVYVHDGTHRSHSSYDDYMQDSSNGIPPRPFFVWALELGAQKEIDDIFDRYSRMLP